MMIPFRRFVPLGLTSVLLLGCGPSPRTPPEEPAPEPGASVLTGEELQRSPGQPIEIQLMTRFPNVTVTRAAAGGLSIRIRGATSIRGDNEALVVIDGVPIEPGPGGALFGINPYDIHTIEVLKDAAATTMYGVRGANGVIVIKTKQAGQ